MALDYKQHVESSYLPGELQQLNALDDILYSLNGKRADTLVHNFIAPPTNLEFSLSGRLVLFLDKLESNYIESNHSKSEYIASLIQKYSERNVHFIHFTETQNTSEETISECLKVCSQKGITVSLSATVTAPLEFYQSILTYDVRYLFLSIDNTSIESKDSTFQKIKKICTTLHKNSESSRTKIIISLNIRKKDFHFLPTTIHKTISELSPHDIRLIPINESKFSSSQRKYFTNTILPSLQKYKNDYPLMYYRLDHFFSIHGTAEHKISKCYIPLDETTIVNNKIYPCSAYAREGGKPICEENDPDQNQRVWNFHRTHNCQKDSICKKHCADITRSFNISVDKKIVQFSRMGFFNIDTILNRILADSRISMLFEHLKRHQQYTLMDHLKHSSITAGKVGKLLHWHDVTIYYLMRSSLVYIKENMHNPSIEPAKGKKSFSLYNHYDSNALLDLGLSIEAQIIKYTNENNTNEHLYKDKPWPMAEVVDLVDRYTNIAQSSTGLVPHKEAIALLKKENSQRYHDEFVSALESIDVNN